MKIAVTGPHCCGKSTLLKRIEPEVINFNASIVPFSGTSCPLNYFDNIAISEESSELDITYWMLSMMLLREIEMKYDKSYDNKIVVFDRCLLDQLVYPYVNLGGKHIQIIENYIEIWLNNNPYNLIFYVPKNEDYLRKVPSFNQDLEYLKNVESAYINILDKHHQKLKNVFFLPRNQDEQKEIIISKIFEMSC